MATAQPALVVAEEPEVHTLSGRLLFRKSVPELHRNQHNGLVWTDKNHILIGGTGTSSVRAISVDITSGRILTGDNRYFGMLSPDRRLVAGVATIGRSVALRVSRLDGSHVQMLARRAPCDRLIRAR